METQRDHRITLLIGLGLLLVGLLAGILTMLLVRPEPTSAPLIADRSLALPRPVAAVDSSASGTPLDLATMNLRFREVANRARAAVVFVQVEGERSHFEWLRGFQGEEGPRLPSQSIGSGVIMSEEGYIVTNDHVVEGAGEILVTLPDRRQFTAEVVGTDRATDLAVLKIPAAEDLPILPFGNSDELQVGEWVLAVGNPFRLTSTVTAGIVSALGRQVNIIEDEFSVEDFIQTDAAINPGNSGGALVNLRGELIGISTAIATESGAYEGYGFAVPSNLALRIASDLIEGGEVQRGFLGVTITEVSTRLALRLGLDRVGGVLLQEVPREGAAYGAGLRPGDIVTHVGGRPVNATNELQSAVARYRPGEVVQLDVLRGGQTRRFAVELTAPTDPATQDFFSRLRPRATPGPNEPPLRQEDSEVTVPEGWGIGLRDVSRRDIETFEVEAGAYVAYVGRGSTADFGGLPRDVVLLAINEMDVTTAEEAAILFESLTSTDPVLLRVKRRDGLVAFYELEVPGAG